MDKKVQIMDIIYAAKYEGINLEDAANDILNLFDVRRSISGMDNTMKEWHKILIENSKDNESYSKGLLKGYECAIRQFDNWLKKYCA